MSGYRVKMRWREDKDKKYDTRTYGLDDLKDLVVFLMKYIDNDKIEWIKVFN